MKICSENRCLSCLSKRKVFKKYSSSMQEMVLDARIVSRLFCTEPVAFLKQKSFTTRNTYLMMVQHRWNVYIRIVETTWRSIKCVLGICHYDLHYTMLELLTLLQLSIEKSTKWNVVVFLPSVLNIAKWLNSSTVMILIAKFKGMQP